MASHPKTTKESSQKVVETSDQKDARVLLIKSAISSDSVSQISKI